MYCEWLSCYSVILMRHEAWELCSQIAGELPRILLNDNNLLIASENFLCITW